MNATRQWILQPFSFNNTLSHSPLSVRVYALRGEVKGLPMEKQGDFKEQTTFWELMKPTEQAVLF